MKKLNINESANYLPVTTAMKELNVSRTTLMKIAKDAKAIIRVSDRIIRIDMAIIKEYLSNECRQEA